MSEKRRIVTISLSTYDYPPDVADWEVRALAAPHLTRPPRWIKSSTTPMYTWLSRPRAERSVVVIFGPELIDKVLDGSKTVTRRPVKYVVNAPEEPEALSPLPCRYEAGRTYAVQPTITEGPGKGRGGKAVGHIRVLSVGRESFDPIGIGWREAEREGFLSPARFAQTWWDLYGTCDPVDVWRIEFEPVSDLIDKGGER